MVNAASEGESASRDFSPFEHTASAINNLPDDEDAEITSDEAWEHFDSGISDGIAANISKRLAQHFT
jgi:hypothetical protein